MFGDMGGKAPWKGSWACTSVRAPAAAGAAASGVSSSAAAARACLRHRVQLLHQERSVRGNKQEAFSRIMVAEVRAYAHFGSKVRVRAVHLHRDTAKHYSGSKAVHKTRWPRLAAILQENNVDILCGDLNMALTQAFPRFRGLGSRLETAAALDGTPCLDSCGNRVLNRPGEHSLRWPLSALHDRDETGLLFASKSLIGETGHRNTSKAEAPAAAGASSSPAPEPRYWHQVPGARELAFGFPCSGPGRYLADWVRAARERREGVLLVSFEPGADVKRDQRKRHLDELIRQSGFYGAVAEECVGALLWNPDRVKKCEDFRALSHGKFLCQAWTVVLAEGAYNPQAKKGGRAQRAQEAALQGAAAAAPEQRGPERQAPERRRERGEQNDSDWPAVGDGRSRRAG